VFISHDCKILAAMGCTSFGELISAATFRGCTAQADKKPPKWHLGDRHWFLRVSACFYFVH